MNEPRPQTLPDEPALSEAWRKRNARNRVLVYATAAFALLAGITSLRFGAMAIDTAGVLGSLVQAFGIDVGTATELDYQVITQLRGPRVCLGFMVGATLSLAGAAMQGMFRNPLADP
ncbi:MAG: iron chelate uptake ABC transporter family permease subunit, partial [Myxococcota bacterium]